MNFSKIASLEEMVNHIYGRASLPIRSDRPHMFSREFMLYVDHLRKEVEKFSQGLSTWTQKYFREFKENLHSGIEYYRGFAQRCLEVQKHRMRILCDLNALQADMDAIALPASLV